MGIYRHSRRAALAGLALAWLVAAGPAAHTRAADRGSTGAHVHVTPAIHAHVHVTPAIHTHHVPRTVLLRSTFTDGPGPWPVSQFATVANGQYNVRVSIEYYAQYYPRVPRRFGDGAIAAIVWLSGKGRGGLMARFHSINGKWSMYACWISNKGTFGCLKDANDTRRPIIRETSSAAINRNTTNTIVLTVIGNHLIFRINSQNVASYTDTTNYVLPPGRWGVYGDNNTPDPFTTHYDTIAIAKA